MMDNPSRSTHSSQEYQQQIQKKYHHIIIKEQSFQSTAFTMISCMNLMIPQSQQQQQSSPEQPNDLLPLSHPHQTLLSIVNSIQFQNKADKNKNKLERMPINALNNQSQSISISSQGSLDRVEKSKIWTQQQGQIFKELLEKHGTDFNYFRSFLPRKSKNQIKLKYKQLLKKQKNQPEKCSTKTKKPKKKLERKYSQDQELPNIQELDIKFQNFQMSCQNPLSQ